MLLEHREKAVGQFFHDDEPLRCHTALAGVVHFCPNGPSDRLVQIGIVEHDESITAASSIVDFLRFWPALAATLFPAPTLPVNATPLMRDRRSPY